MLSPTLIPGVAGQWLRFLHAEFLQPQHRLAGRVDIECMGGRYRSVLIGEGDGVFEGDYDPAEDFTEGPDAG